MYFRREYRAKWACSINNSVGDVRTANRSKSSEFLESAVSTVAKTRPLDERFSSFDSLWMRRSNREKTELRLGYGEQFEMRDICLRLV